DKRPDIREVLAAIGPLEQKEKIAEDELVDCIDTLVADPTNAEAAIALETTIERDADPRQVAEAFLMAAEMLDPEEAAAAARSEESSEAVAAMKAEAARDRALEQKRSLLFRSARIFDSKLQDA